MNGALTGRRAPVCDAPFVSMYLDQHGSVRACCMNVEHPLGSIVEDRLLAIWHGERARRLRDAVDAGDLGLGCQQCAWQQHLGGREAMFARTFDHLGRSGSELWPRQLELSMSNACNLQCVMCNGDWSSSIRTHREGRPPLPVVYDEAFFEDLAVFLPHLDRVNFLGGEPLLGRESLRVMDMLGALERDIDVHLTTNGTVWSDRVERLLATLTPQVTVSIDGATPSVYESIRKGASWDDVQRNLSRFRDALGADHVSLAFCLMTTNWTELFDFCLAADAAGFECTVNTVTAPSHMSLYSQPVREVERVVEALEHEDAARGRSLHASAPVWRAELARLRGHLEDLRVQAPRPADDPATDGAAVQLRGSARVEELSRVVDPQDLRDRFVQRDAQRFGFGPSSIVADVDPGQQLIDVDPCDLIGRSLEAIGELLAGKAERESIELIHVLPQARVWRLRYSDGRLVTALLLTSAVGPDYPPTELLLIDEAE